jgi:hypothetical protein
MASESGKSGDKGWLYGGDPRDYQRMKELIEGELLADGGMSLAGHWLLQRCDHCAEDC